MPPAASQFSTGQGRAAGESTESQPVVGKTQSSAPVLGKDNMLLSFSYKILQIMRSKGSNINKHLQHVSLFPVLSNCSSSTFSNQAFN